MKKYRKTADLGQGYRDLPWELARELAYTLHIMETEYPDDGNACVVLLDENDEWDEARAVTLGLHGEPEIDEWTGCVDDLSRYRKIVYVTGQDGSGVVVFQWDRAKR